MLLHFSHSTYLVLNESFILITFGLQGIVVFASVMATLGLQILFESMREIIVKVEK